MIFILTICLGQFFTTILNLEVVPFPEEKVGLSPSLSLYLSLSLSHSLFLSIYLSISFSISLSHFFEQSLAHFSHPCLFSSYLSLKTLSMHALQKPKLRDLFVAKAARATPHIILSIIALLLSFARPSLKLTPEDFTKGEDDDSNVQIRDLVKRDVGSRQAFDYSSITVRGGPCTAHDPSDSCAIPTQLSVNGASGAEGAKKQAALPVKVAAAGAWSENDSTRLVRALTKFPGEKGWLVYSTFCPFKFDACCTF